MDLYPSFEGGEGRFLRLRPALAGRRRDLPNAYRLNVHTRQIKKGRQGPPRYDSFKRVPVNVPLPARPSVAFRNNALW